MRYEPPLAGHVPERERHVRSLLESGHYEQARDALDVVLSDGQSSVDEQWDRATVLINRAQLALRLDRIPAALELVAEGWTELDSAGIGGTPAANPLGLLGYVVEGIGHQEQALELMALSVQLARGGDDTETLAHCLTREGTSRMMRAATSPNTAVEDFTTAHQLLDEAVSLAAQGQMHRRALAANARTLAGVGDPDAAVEQALRALRLSERSADRFSASLANWVLAGVARKRNEHEDARTYASRALEAAEQINDTTLMTRCSLDLAGICEEIGDPTGEAAALRRTVRASKLAADMLREGLGQALEQRRVAVQAQRMASAARAAASRDSLTGLLNRRGLEHRAPALLERAAQQGRQPWLVLVDVDRFKDINDRAGHAAGDLALQQVAYLLRSECRNEDLVCRWAGDEFVLLLRDSPGERRSAGPAVAERVRAAVSQHDWDLILGHTEQSPTVSIGAASGASELDDLFTAADHALYRAKRAGRNRVEVDGEPASEDESAGP